MPNLNVGGLTYENMGEAQDAINRGAQVSGRKNRNRKVYHAPEYCEVCGKRTDFRIIEGALEERRVCLVCGNQRRFVVR